MKPVSDPNLIAQLDAGGQGGMRPVSDPNLISQLDGMGAQEAAPAQKGFNPINYVRENYNPGGKVVNFINSHPALRDTLTKVNNSQFVQDLAGSPATNAIMGAGDALRDSYGNMAGFLSGGKLDMSAPKHGKGLAYGIGKFGGDVLGYLTQAELGGQALGAASPKLANQGGAMGVLRRAGGNALYGAANMPDDRTTGAAIGTGVSLAADSLPGIFKIAGKAIQGVKPQQFADELLTNLGAGKSIENNAKSIADDITQAFKTRKGEGDALYNSVFDNIPSGNIFNQGIKSEYQSLTPKILDRYDLKLGDLHGQFLENPTFKNAHELTSQINSNLRQLGKKISSGGSDQAQRNEYQALSMAKDALKKDIGSYFTQINRSDLKDSYQAANNYWRDNVVPYTHSEIAPLATGKVTNPTNSSITSMFKNPEPELQKILGDLPSNFNHKVLYNELGKTASQKNLKNLLNTYESLDQKGLSSYVTPELAEKMGTLGKRMSAKESLQSTLGAMSGYSLGMGIGMPSLEAIGAVGGFKFAPSIMNKVAQHLPSIGPVKKAIGKSYPLTAKAVIANLLAGNSQ